jgi:hypothetical protein
MTSRRYAEDTRVPVERSRVDVEVLLVRYGATAFGYAWEGERTIISFKLQDRFIRMLVPMPERGAYKTQASYDQAVRARWRALVLVLKAKLEAVASGITTLEREFLADVVLPDNRTVAQWLAPQLADAYRSGNMPPLLPAPKGDA